MMTSIRAFIHRLIFSGPSKLKSSRLRAGDVTYGKNKTSIMGIIYGCLVFYPFYLSQRKLNNNTSIFPHKHASASVCLSVFVSLCLCLTSCLSVCVSVGPFSLCPCVSLSHCLCLSVCMFVFVSVCLSWSLYLCVCVPVCISLSPPVRGSVFVLSLSLCLHLFVCPCPYMSPCLY